MQPKPWTVAKGKTYEETKLLPCPKNKEVEKKFTYFCSVYEILQDFLEETAALQKLDEAVFCHYHPDEDDDNDEDDEEEEEEFALTERDQRKKEKSMARMEKWKQRSRRMESAQSKFEEKFDRLSRLGKEFGKHYAKDAELVESLTKPGNIVVDKAQQENDPILLLVRECTVKMDNCSEASTKDNYYQQQQQQMDEDEFLDMYFVMVPEKVQCSVMGTTESMNPLSGYEVVPEMQDAFRKFLRERDAQLKMKSSMQRKERIMLERSRASRYDENLCTLFDTVVDAFVEFMTGCFCGGGSSSSSSKNKVFAFKYCPTPGCSADKGTGNLETGGVGEAMARRFAALKGFPAAQLSPHGKEFKMWVSTHRRTYGIPESFIGCRQLKQIDLAKAPAMHIRKWMDTIHMKHNPEGVDQFQKGAMERLRQGKKKGVNASNLMPHELLEDIAAGNSVAGLQFMSIIQKTKVPDSISIMPVVDVSGSMAGTPMKVAIAMGMIISYCQSEDSSPFHRMFMTFDQFPRIYKFPPLFGDNDSSSSSVLQRVVNNMYDMPAGFSTDFHRSMKMMLEEMLDDKEQQGDCRDQKKRRPMLMVFTDMQFDSADSCLTYNETNLDAMERMYKEAGIDMPLIVFWNVRGDMLLQQQQGGAAAAASTSRKNVVMLSGFSTNLMEDFFKMLESGNFSDAVAAEAAEDYYHEDEEKEKQKNHLNTDSVIETVLQSDMYSRYIFC